jgi:hypothetical protein
VRLVKRLTNGDASLGYNAFGNVLILVTSARHRIRDGSLSSWAQWLA